MKNQSVAKLVRSLPIVQTILTSTNFPVAATVETDMKLYEDGFRYADSGKLKSRWFRSIRAADGRVLWLFEDEQDARLFEWRVGGEARQPISIGEWQSRGVTN